ncbi:FKBP-type peptidyl-prolyl cis-trans isomerase [Marichromatium gracile]|uniref:peptidylprolyl isomerase n=1 Tax=Marichromatium gracile TaxID=1048 RepID=A0ABR5VLN0_MARGR|nr:FKBP-type peptidyl-prolyl cis-trans isomerase [Marichromatium gracile]KXX66211.1 peptidylprolyl isomerase [Marichromatium gracile]
MVINDTLSTPAETVSEPPLAVAAGRRITFHLQVRFPDGFVAFSTFKEDPIRCTVGDGTLTPALEAAIDGLLAGTETEFAGDGSELFAAYDENNVFWLERSEFPPGLHPEPGKVIAFETPAGQETSGMVLETEGERVRVDFNHPFAGRALQLRIAILTVEA